MNNVPMGKWKIGVLVLGLISIGLFVYVIVQGLQSKQDRQTLKSAQSIATKLNDYIDQKQQIPGSLSIAGISDVPDTISYKKSSSSYEFCVTYKAANSDVAATVQNDLLRSTTNGGLTGGSSDYSSLSDTGSPSSLYIDPTHQAGKQCQTVKPYIYSSDFTDPYNYDYNSNGTDNSDLQDYLNSQQDNSSLYNQ